jgi:hypothetical protein
MTEPHYHPLVVKARRYAGLLNQGFAGFPLERD